MGVFGDNLRREREMRGVSLSEICTATKIGTRMLDAIETERFERLPGGVFNAAFVRQYARYLGLDEDRTVAEFMAACGDSAATQAARDTQQREAALATLRQMSSNDSSDRPQPVTLIVATVLLITGALVVGGWRMWGPRGAAMPAVTPAARATTSTTSPVPQQIPVPLPSIPVQQPPQEAAAPVEASEIALELEAKDRCTIEISQDGHKSWELVMRRGTHRNVKALRTVRLTVDNAAALVVTRNGETLPSLGGKNEAKTVTFKR
jgi:cytoskeletal protein RodZ